MNEGNEEKEEDNSEIEKKWNYLNSKKTILNGNIKSINQRWNQEYLWKLKQLSEIAESSKELERKYEEISKKLEE